MADLALVVSIMLGYTLVAGALAIFAIRRPPNGLFTRMLIMVLLVPALYLSFRLLIVVSPLFMKIVFGAIGVSCVLAIRSLIRKPRLG
jgi:hypothetical protein